MEDTTNGPPVSMAAAHKARPEKPDQARFEADLAAAEKEHTTNMEKYNAAKLRFENAKAGKNSPANEKWNSLVAEQRKITDQQREIKQSKTAQRERFNLADSQLKSMINEQKDARARMGYKSVGEIDAKIAELTRQVDQGTMSMVEEKKALSEVSNLNRRRKGFAPFEEMERRIDAKKAETAELKKTIDNPESRALEEKYDAVRKELDQMSAVRDQDRNNFSSLRDEKERLNQQQQGSWQKIREIKDNFSQAKKAWKVYEDELYQQRRERQKAEREAYEKDRRKRMAEQKLEEAGQPAFLDEILTTEGLIRYFDPSSNVSDSRKEPGKLAASAQRTVEDSGPKGMKVMKKDEEDFFVGGGGKKKGKAKKQTAEGSKFHMSIGIIEELGKVGVEPPSSQSEVPATVDRLKAKLDDWKQRQAEQTKKNIDKAQREIDRLGAQADEATAKSGLPVTTKAAPGAGEGRRDDATKKPAIDNQGVITGDDHRHISTEAELDQEREAIADVTVDMKKAEIEDARDAEAMKT